MTLLTYLTSHSPQSTANALHVARNTVSYRLANAAELLGRPVDERQLETWTALRLLEFTHPATDSLRPTTQRPSGR